MTNELVRRLAQNFGLSEGVAARVVEDVFDALDQPVDAFIEDRHAALQGLGLRNEAIYERLSLELAGWRFRAPELTKRQIRRRIYG